MYFFIIILDENESMAKNGKAIISKYKSFICFKIHDFSPKKIEK